jgi:hypothetical protein
MPDFSRWGANGGDPSLNAIARTDKFLDALASEQPVYSTDPADAELAQLMVGWRDDVRVPPTTVMSQRDAVVALQRSVAARQRTRLSMAVLGSVAAALLCLGGFGAVVYGAGPGDALYGLRTTLFGEQLVTRDDQVVLAAQTQVQEVQQLIDKGDWTAAQEKLQTLSTTVQTVEDGQRKQELQDKFNQLSVKVENRDPNATLPPQPIAPPPAGGSVPAVIEGPPSPSSETTTTTTSPSTSSKPAEPPPPPPESDTSTSPSTSSKPAAPPPPPLPPASDTTTTTTSSPVPRPPALGGGESKVEAPAPPAKPAPPAVAVPPAAPAPPAAPVPPAAPGLQAPQEPRKVDEPVTTTPVVENPKKSRGD